MTSLITGANGFIGRRLFQPSDRGLMRNTTTTYSVACGDLLDFSSLALACQGIETVSTALVTHMRFHRLILMFTGGLITRVRAIYSMLRVRWGVRRFIFLSTVKAMAEPSDVCVDEGWPGEPLTPYGKSKRAAEDAVLEAGTKFGMHVVNLRLAMVYGRGGRGNLERMVHAIRSGWFPPLPETGNRRSLVHVQDVVEVMRLVAEQSTASGRTYIVVDSQAYSGRVIYEAIRNAHERPEGMGAGTLIMAGLKT